VRFLTRQKSKQKERSGPRGQRKEQPENDTGPRGKKVPNKKKKAGGGGGQAKKSCRGEGKDRALLGGEWARKVCFRNPGYQKPGERKRVKSIPIGEKKKKNENKLEWGGVVPKKKSS